jgi:hypothetical protein
MNFLRWEYVMRCNSYLIWKLAIVAVAACLSACPGDKPKPPGLVLPPPQVLQPPPPPPATQQLFIRREWRFQVFHNPDLPFEDVRPMPDGGSMTYGVLDDFVDFGKTQYSLPFEDQNSNAHVFSNETGKTFWVYTRAPRASLANDFANGAHAAIRQYMHFRKNAANATYRQVISQVWLEAVDGNPLRPLECLRHPT